MNIKEDYGLPHHARIRVDILDITGSPWYVLEDVLRRANGFESQAYNVAHFVAVCREKTGEIPNTETVFFLEFPGLNSCQLAPSASSKGRIFTSKMSDQPFPVTTITHEP
ncbi:hypothetical protein ACEN9F_15875 [Duganella sp. CT11-25]|uniref:hypothetical protein n=1 Tax=unclassified Duganella TaxID=2636909 RepID=UPI0039AFA716